MSVDNKTVSIGGDVFNAQLKSLSPPLPVDPTNPSTGPPWYAPGNLTDWPVHLRQQGAYVVLSISRAVVEKYINGPIAPLSTSSRAFRNAG